MKTKILAAVVILALCPRIFAGMDIITESIYDVLSEKIKGDAGNLKDPEYLEKLVNAVADGTSDQMVQEIVDNYDPASVASEIGMKLLEKLVPAAAGPITLILKANQIATDGVRDWIDWAKANRMEEFNTQVIEKGKTLAELEAAWNNFNDEFIQTGLSDTGVPYAERPDLLRDMKVAYAVRRKELMIEEEKKNAIKAKIEAKQRAYKYFRWLRMEARVKAEGVVSMLKITGQPVTSENVKKALKDPKAYQELNAKWLKEVEKAAEVKDGAPARPPVITGDPELDKAAAIVTVSKKTVPENSVPDYGPVLTEYGQNADRLAAGAASPSEYSQVNSALWTAAENMHSACVKPILQRLSNCSPDMKQHYRNLYDACMAANQAYKEGTDKVNARLGEQAGALRKELDAFTMGGPGGYNKPNTPLADFTAKLKAEFYGSPQGKKLEDADWLAYQLGINNAYEAHSQWAGVSWAGKEPPPLQKLKQYSGRFSGAAAVFELLTPIAATMSSQLQAKIQEFETAYNQASGKYSDLYQRNSFLAERFDIEPYNFAVQRKDLEAARAELANPKSFANSSFMAALSDGTRVMRREQAAWDNAITLNEQFIADFTAAPDQMLSLTKWAGAKGGMELSQKNLEAYFDANFKDFMMNFLQGALILLDEKTRAQFMTGQQQETKPFGNGSKTVMEIAGTPSYTTLAEHNKKLDEFAKKLAELKQMDLEGRSAKAAELAGKMSSARGKLTVASAETEAILAAFGKEAVKAGGLNGSCSDYTVYIGDRCLSYPMLEGAYRAYESRIRKAEEYERKGVEACRKALADPKYDSWNDTSLIFSASKWKPSSQLTAACGAVDKVRSEASEKEFRKYTPFREATIAGRPLAPGSLELRRTDLAGGKATVRGTLHPDAPAYTQVYVSLNSDYSHREPGQTIALSGGAFEYSFEPMPGETYYVGVQAIGGPGGMASQALPASGHMTVRIAQENRTAEIQAFYDRFRTAYEGRNAPQVMALISPDWSSGDDDTAVADLEENLRTNFRLYDEIRFSFSGLRVTAAGGALQACYDTVITSRIFKRNLKHEEKAAVCDELREEGGRLKIVRTLSGRYWYVK